MKTLVVLIRYKLVYLLLFLLTSCMTMVQYEINDVTVLPELKKTKHFCKLVEFEDATLGQEYYIYPWNKRYVKLNSVLYVHNERNRYQYGLAKEFTEMVKDHLVSYGFKLKNDASDLVISGSITNFESFTEFNPEYQKKLNGARTLGGFLLGGLGRGIATKIVDDEENGLPLKQISQVGFSVQVKKGNEIIFKKYYSISEVKSVKYLDNENTTVYAYPNEVMKKLVDQLALDLKNLVNDK